MTDRGDDLLTRGALLVHVGIWPVLRTAAWMRPHAASWVSHNATFRSMA